jgi:hypothetical protein
MLRIMDYCEHCEGQRFDRARVLRALRQLRRQLPNGARLDGDEALKLALRALRDLDIPHLDFVDSEDDHEIIH